MSMDKYLSNFSDIEIEAMIKRLSENQLARYMAYRCIHNYDKRYALYLASSWPMEEVK